MMITKNRIAHSCIEAFSNFFILFIKNTEFQKLHKICCRKTSVLICKVLSYLVTHHFEFVPNYCACTGDSTASVRANSGKDPKTIQFSVDIKGSRMTGVKPGIHKILRLCKTKRCCKISISKGLHFDQQTFLIFSSFKSKGTSLKNVVVWHAVTSIKAILDCLGCIS